MAWIPESAGTFVGTSTVPPVLPSPDCPLAFCPQTHTSPFTSSATEWAIPAASALMAGSPLTLEGEGRGVLLVVPVPNCPAAFWPHAQTAPSFFRNREW